MRSLLLLFLLPATLLGCGDDAPSGGGGGGGADDGTGGGGGEPCGVAGCEIACDTSDDCPSLHVCKKYDASCQPLEQGRCEEAPIECGHVPSPLACLCSGTLAPSECVPLGPEQLADPATCGGETFACGDTTCASVVEVCVQTTDAIGTTYACADAADRGCGEFGVADCACITTSGLGEACHAEQPGQVTLSISTVGPACEPAACALDQACVDYVTDMSTGTQCVALGSCTDCACAVSQHCANGDAVCEMVAGGLHLSNCFFAP